MTDKVAKHQKFSEAHKTESIYRDFSQVEDPSMSTDGSDMGQNTLQSLEGSFPMILHYMLSELEADGLSHIASWQPNGRCFLVHKHDEFVDVVLRRWFRQTKYPSFQRQLNIYGFNRITSGPNKNAYYNELFLRGKFFLSQQIPRVKVKGTGPRRPHAYKADPDFSSLPILPPSPKAGPGGNSSAPEQKVQKHPSSIPVTYFPATPARDGPFIPSPCAKDIASRQMLLPSCAHHMAENQNFRHFDMGSVSCFPQSLAIESFAPPATLLMMRQQAMLQNFALPSALSVEAMNQISTLQIIAARRRAALTLQANSMMQDRRTDLHQRSVSEKRRLMASMLDEALLI